ncbi:SDR family NAD(P)-dependent oxidoreductase [Micromonospora sp. NPDC005305]|uniref:SDR family NAD(P)-dependent oxidoreductase n=1 Tax=Micromonospora sp. NPDC005305 TaxID=3156875 RepID=UPI0033B0A3EE
MSTPTSGGPLAVVTGASSGIGYELAAQFTEHGYDVVVAAEDPGIATAARNLQRDSGPQAYPVRVDLATPDGVEQLARAVTDLGRPVDALALNAGRGGRDLRGRHRPERRAEHRRPERAVDRAPGQAAAAGHGRARPGAGAVHLVDRRDHAGGVPAVYNASKSFVQSFAEALRNELKDSGVTVTSLMPGPTDTGFFARADMEDTRVGQGKKDDPRAVAEDAFEALMKGEHKVSAGSLLNKVQTAAGKIVPDRLKAEQHRKMAEPGSGS